MKRRAFIILVVIGLLVISTQSVAARPLNQTEEFETYLVLSKSETSLPANLEAKVAAAGGTLLRTIPEIGVAVVQAPTGAFKTKMGKVTGIRSVMPNVKMGLIDPPYQEAVEAEIANPPTSGNDDFYFDLQWGMDAINAPEAWAKGARGAGVRIAILDTGFDTDHPDLAENINLDLSANFVPGETLEYALPDPFSHGTHTAGIAAAADNGFGVIGVAPEAELVLVKVLDDEGEGEFDYVLSGIVHAANVDADIASMSLGALLPVKGTDWINKKEVAELVIALTRAANYAYKHGTTLIASAGNDATNLDTLEYINLPSDAPGFISISATTPIGWAVDPATNLDVPTSYTNYGKRAIDFAAPGGDALYPGEESCTVGGLTRPCWVFDLVFSTGANLDPAVASYFWAGGTSMSCPHAAGVAALIIGKYGGDLNPLIVRSLLLATSDDLGPLGKDAYYGFGRVNAKRAVTLLR